MKKKIFSIIMILMFIISSFISVCVTGKNIKMISSELESSEDKAYDLDLFNLLKEYDLSHTGSLDSNNYISPISLESWQSNYYDKTQGYKSVLYKGYLFVVVELNDVVDDTVVNRHVALLKYNANNFDLVESGILDMNLESNPVGIVSYNNSIFVLVKCFSGMYYVGYSIIKLDTDLTVNDYCFYEQSQFPYYDPIAIESDDSGIYIAGLEKGYNFDIYIGKFDEHCECIWENYETWGRAKNEDLYPGCLTIYDNYIFITGLSDIESDEFGFESFVLKYSTDGNFEKVIFGGDSKSGTAITGYNDGIYVCSGYFTGEDDLGISNDIIVESYNTDLSLEWSMVFDDTLVERVEDIVVVGENLYLSGFLMDIFNIDLNQFFTLNGYIMKLNRDNGEREWMKLVNEYSWAWSIHCDNNNLYLSGLMLDLAESTHSFVLKCDMNGGTKLKISPMEIEFGKIKQGKLKNKEFLIENVDIQSSTLHWDITEYPDWEGFEISQLSGDLAPGEKTTVIVSVNTSYLSVDTYDDDISIETDGETKTVKITFKVEKTRTGFARLVFLKSLFKLTLEKLNLLSIFY